MVTVDRTSLDSFLPPRQLERMVPQLQAAWDTLWKGTGAGNDFLGWRDLPVDYDRAVPAHPGGSPAHSGGF